MSKDTKQTVYDDLLEAERRHLKTQMIRVAKWAVHHKMPHTTEECERYNKRITTLMKRIEYLDYALQQKEKE